MKNKRGDTGNLQIIGGKGDFDKMKGNLENKSSWENP